MALQVKWIKARKHICGETNKKLNRSKHTMKQRLHWCASEIVVSLCAAEFFSVCWEIYHFHCKQWGFTPNKQLKLWKMKKKESRRYFYKILPVLPLYCGGSKAWRLWITIGQPNAQDLSETPFCMKGKEILSLSGFGSSNLLPRIFFLHNFFKVGLV